MKTSLLQAFDYSIEYCHIYTNERISGEHASSVNKLKRIVAQMEKSRTYNLCVMVDDYTFPEENFDYDSFYEWLHIMDAIPHVFIRETSLIPSADEVVELIDDTKRKKRLRNYIARKRYPCSLFIAAWYLSRLGKLQTLAHA
ncbi:MAG: hypothetical protein AAB834_02155, partial [Patescibacteria group bacterium]